MENLQPSSDILPDLMLMDVVVPKGVSQPEKSHVFKESVFILFGSFSNLRIGSKVPDVF